MTARFGYCLRQATNEDAPLGHRVHALKDLVAAFASLTRLGYMSTWKLVGEALELEEPIRYLSGAATNPGSRWLTGREINAIAHLLEQQRHRFLSEVRQFDAIRRAEKSEGKRQPAQRQIANLYSRAWIPPPPASLGCPFQPSHHCLGDRHAKPEG